MWTPTDSPWTAGGGKIQNQQRRPDAKIRYAPGKDMQISPRSCPPSGQLVLLKIYDLIFKFRNKSCILDLLFLTVPVRVGLFQMDLRMYTELTSNKYY